MLQLRYEPLDNPQAIETYFIDTEAQVVSTGERRWWRRLTATGWRPVGVAEDTLLRRIRLSIQEEALGYPGAMVPTLREMWEDAIAKDRVLKDRLR